MSKHISLIIIVIVSVASLIFCFSNYWWGLPMVDFRPYMEGNYLPDQMIGIPDSVEFKFIYEDASGVQHSFGMDELDKADGMTYVDREEVILKAGVPAPIANWYIENSDGEDISDMILHNSNYQFFVVAYDLSKTNKDAFIEKVNPLQEHCDNKGHEMFCVSSNPTEEFRHDVQAAYPFHVGDATFLKTIVRSNPGLMILKDGHVVAKFHHTEIPTFEVIEQQYLK